MSENTSPLDYAVTVERRQVPEPREADVPDSGRLEITVSVPPAAQRAVTCRAITFTIPSGTAPGALTSLPDRIDTACRAERTWSITRIDTEPDRTKFFVRPLNPRRVAIFEPGSKFTLILDSIPLNAPPGVTSIEIDDDTGAGEQATTNHSTLTLHAT